MKFMDILTAFGNAILGTEYTTTSGRKITSSQLNQIKRETTNRVTVETLLGEPTSATASTNGKTMLFYYCESKEWIGLPLMTLVSFMPGVCHVSSIAAVNAPGPKIHTQFLTVWLSKDGIVEDYVLSESSATDISRSKPLSHAGSGEAGSRYNEVDLS